MSSLDIWQLKQRQGHPLEIKIRLSEERIKSWYDYYQGNVYVAFSGGKDSTVLLNIVRSLYPHVPAVFCDTGLEYPENRALVKQTDNVIWVKPKMAFKKVIDTYGYPVISKEQSQYIYEVTTTKSDKLKNIRLNGNKTGRGKISKKWQYLLNSNIKISHKCCDILKKNPSKQYEKEFNTHPYIGVMAQESSKRTQDYLKFGCNAYECNRPISRPLAFWTEQDIWEYLKRFNIPYSKIYDMGYTRTGCMFCMYGVHLEKEPNRFQKMYNTHPNQYDYCINHLGIGKILDSIYVKYIP